MAKRKYVVRGVLLALCILMAAVLGGCGKKDPIIGDWTMIDMVDPETGKTLEELISENTQVSDMLSNLTIDLSFKEDQSCAGTMSMGREMEAEGEWKVAEAPEEGMSQMYEVHLGSDDMKAFFNKDDAEHLHIIIAPFECTMEKVNK